MDVLNINIYKYILYTVGGESSEYCSEGSGMGTEVGSEVGTAVCSVVKALKCEQR